MRRLVLGLAAAALVSCTTARPVEHKCAVCEPRQPLSDACMRDGTCPQCGPEKCGQCGRAHAGKCERCPTCGAHAKETCATCSKPARETDPGAAGIRCADCAAKAGHSSRCPTCGAERKHESCARCGGCRECTGR